MFFGAVPGNLKDQAISLEKLNKSVVQKIVCGNHHILVLFGIQTL